MTVQHVHVAEGGQAIVGNVSTTAAGGGAIEKSEEQPHALGYAPGVEMPRQIEEKRANSAERRPSGGVTSAGCMAPVAALLEAIGTL